MALIYYSLFCTLEEFTLAYSAEQSDGKLADAVEDVDLFDRIQLAKLVRICSLKASLGAAGRALFSASRAQRGSSTPPTVPQISRALRA